MRAHLSVEAGVAEPREVELSPGMTVSLGRNGKNNIYVHDERASRFHAEVFFADGAWHLRDCDTLNGTRLNGERIRQVVRLNPGCLIGVGEVRLRFSVGKGAGAAGPARGSGPGGSAPGRSSESSSTHLDPDGLSVLLQFMNASLVETTPHGLVMLALRALRQHTRASLCGFLGFDAEDDQLKVVLPADAALDVPLSRQLTAKVRREGRTAWLHGGADDDDALKSGSLAAYHDAVCVPLRRDAAGQDPAASPVGALHAYHAGREFGEREVRFCEVLAGNLANALHVLRSRRAMAADYSRLRGRANRDGDVMVGDSPALAQLREEIARLARAPVTVLIEGESGVGKELVALALHRQSPWHEGPLVTVNCGALCASVVDAELFGHEKGAFTGADRQRIGLFQQADEGTLFLDEIGEMSQETQSRLLRVLENKRVRRMMSATEVAVDVRVIAATNRDLDKEARAGRFRRDLLFRLGVRLHVPPLREHLGDVPALADYFLAKLNAEYRREVRLSPEALRCLQDFHWPGNVRQLRTVLEAAVAMSPGDLLRPADLRLDVDAGDSAPQSETFNLEEVEARTIREVLVRTGGARGKAAKLLGIHRETLINKIRRYGIDAGPGDQADDAEINGEA